MIKIKYNKLKQLKKIRGVVNVTKMWMNIQIYKYI